MPKKFYVGRKMRKFPDVFPVGDILQEKSIRC